MPSSVSYIETTGNNSGYENKHKNQMYVYLFTVCDSCFWCASAQNLYFINNETSLKCPLCDGDRITLTPILRS